MQEMQKFTLGTAVLAGGKSSRMGQNKVLMEEHTSELQSH